MASIEEILAQIEATIAARERDPSLIPSEPPKEGRRRHIVGGPGSAELDDAIGVLRDGDDAAASELLEAVACLPYDPSREPSRLAFVAHRYLFHEVNDARTGIRGHAWLRAADAVLNGPAATRNALAKNEIRVVLSVIREMCVTLDNWHMPATDRRKLDKLLAWQLLTPPLTQRTMTRDALVDAAMDVIGISLDYEDELPASAR